jgi:hypothetical protein
MVVDGFALTPAELVELIEAEHLSVDAGLELLDADDVLIEDISADLIAEGSSIERNIYRTIHGTCSLNISRELVWGRQRLRPFLLLSSDAPVRTSGGPEPLLDDDDELLLSDDGEPLLTDDPYVHTEPTWYRFDLGVFLPSVPERVVASSPAVWSVQCFDKLDILNTPHGASYSLAVGDNVPDAVTALIMAAGESKVSIAPSDEAVTSDSDRMFSIVDEYTTLELCNLLLDSIGYRALFVDRAGVYRSEPSIEPSELSTVWSYSADSPTTTVAEERSSASDYYQAANQIVGIRESVFSGFIPELGDGIYIQTNQSDGPISVDGRGGRIIRKVIRGEFVSQYAMERAVGDAMVAEKRLAGYIDMQVSPNPVHGHFDVVAYRDDAIPTNGRYLVTDWTLPLDASDMSLSLRTV